MADVMLTTVDNKKDPFDDFLGWFQEDLYLGHNTCGVLSEIAKTSNILSDEDNEAIIEAAMDEIIANDVTNTFIKVYKQNH